MTTLLEYLDKHPHDCLVPIKEETIDPILAQRAEFAQVTRLPFASDDIFEICRDKSKTIKLARQIGVPHPTTVLPLGASTLLEKVKYLKYPLVIKPRRNCAGEGIHFVQNESELVTQYQLVHNEFPFPLIQEAIPAGEKYDVCCLYDENGKCVATFTQREVRCYPLQDGPSTLQESVWRPDLVELAQQMLHKVNWYGIAEAEFMIDPRDGSPKLMEINPRLWGSVELAIQCGVDFPYLLYQLALGKRIEPIQRYQVGLMCRQLLPYDILHFIANPKRFEMQPSFFNFFDKRCKYNIVSLRDPGPTLGFLLTCGRYLFDAEMWRRLARINVSKKQPIRSCDYDQQPTIEKEPSLSDDPDFDLLKDLQ